MNRTMSASEFNSRKMRWLNGVHADCRINSTAFRVAYAIADHLNRVVGYAWPSEARLADRICLSLKSISRAVAQLEALGWLRVTRSNRSANQYRLNWPDGRDDEAIEKSTVDKSVADPGQICPPNGDNNVPQSYLDNLPKPYSSGTGERKGTRARFKDRGTYERRIAERFGPETWDVFAALSQIDPHAIEWLCDKEKSGQLVPSDMAAARLAVTQTRRRL